MEAVDFFRNLDLFKQLGEAELERLASSFKQVSFPEGLIIKDNDVADGLYIIQTGMAKVTKSSTGTTGVEAMPAILRPGNSFGELSLIDGLPRSANVSAMAPLTAYFLPRDDFLRALEENPQIALGLLQALTTMVRSANQWVAQLA